MALSKNDLEELNNLFNDVKDKSDEEINDYFTLPDGNYNATIDDLEVTESKAGNPMFVISFKIVDGEFKDVIHKQFVMLSGNTDELRKRNIHTYATLVKKLGVDTTKGIQYTFDNLGIGLNKKVILKITTTVAKSTGKSYTNTSFDVI